MKVCNLLINRVKETEKQREINRGGGIEREREREREIKKGNVKCT